MQTTIQNGYATSVETHADGTKTRIEWYPDGTIDEIVTRQPVHIEQMSDNHIWMNIAERHYGFSARLRLSEDGWQWWRLHRWWQIWRIWDLRVTLRMIWSDRADDENLPC